MIWNTLKIGKKIFHCSGASERASGWASGPLLTFRFHNLLNHCVEQAWIEKIDPFANACKIWQPNLPRPYSLYFIIVENLVMMFLLKQRQREPKEKEDNEGGEIAQCPWFWFSELSKVQLNPAWAHPDQRHNLSWSHWKIVWIGWALVISLIANSAFKATPHEGKNLCGSLENVPSGINYFCG